LPRATSKDMDLKHLNKWARIKGINILGTGDFTHPDYFKEIRENLEPLGNGLFKFKGDLDKNSPFFILTSEISCIYSKGGKCRRMHNLVFAPSFEAVEEINKRLAKIGNLHSDGRPILGLDSKELLKIVLDVSPDCFFVPAHIWTPWFSLFGSKSGFDSTEECFEELTPYIYAMETGLSSDPAMNWRLSALDNITLISNSDAHSLANLGREANVFEIGRDISYKKIIDAIKNRDKKEFKYTIEFFPEEGKYHFDGHRNCKIRFSPQKTQKHKGICPVCKKPLTVGVMNRVEELADRPENFKPQNAIPYKSLVPLQEIIARVLQKGKNTKIVKVQYDSLISKGENEFKVLLDLPEKELIKITLPEIAQGILNIRKRRIKVNPGYDGVYGTIDFLDKIKRLEQGELF